MISFSFVLCIPRYSCCTYVKVDQTAGEEGEEAAVEIPEDVRDSDPGVVGAATMVPLLLPIKLLLPSLFLLFESFLTC